MDKTIAAVRRKLIRSLKAGVEPLLHRSGYGIRIRTFPGYKSRKLRGALTIDTWMGFTEHGIIRRPQ